MIGGLGLDPARRLGLKIPLSADRPHAGAPALRWNPPHIAEQARTHSSATLLHITKAALTGSLNHVTGSFWTQRYQQLVVFVLIACHNIAEPPPNLLSDLAGYTGAQLAPSPHYVLGALTRELERMSTEDTTSVALALLPEGVIC